MYCKAVCTMNQPIISMSQIMMMFAAQFLSISPKPSNSILEISQSYFRYILYFY